MIKFYSKSRQYRELSNFYPLNLTLDRHTFISGEHAFHYYKYYLSSTTSKSTRRSKILADYAETFIGNRYSTATEAKQAGGKSGLLLFDNEIKTWNTVSERVQKNICQAKIEQHHLIRDLLVETDTGYLLHQENRGKNPIWGGRISKTTGQLIGANKLGLIWMDLRTLYHNIPVSVISLDPC